MDEQTKHAMKTIRGEFSRTGWALFAGMLVPVALSVAAGLLIGVLMPQLLDSDVLMFLTGFLPVYGVGLPLAMLILRAVPAETGVKRTLGPGRFWQLMLMAVPVTLAGNIVGNLLGALFSFGQAVNPLEDLASAFNPYAVFSMLVLAPVLEELLFRKFLLDRCAKFGRWNAIVFSALAFSMFHANIYQMVYAFGLGLLFGYVYLHTRRLRYTMAMHFLINFFGGLVGPALLLYFPLDDLNMSMPVLIYEGVMLLLGAAGLVLLVMHRKDFRLPQAPWELPRGIRGRLTYGNAGVIFFLVLTGIQTVITLVQSVFYY